MTNEAEEAATTVSAGPAWYAKLFEYVKNRNRIGPGRVELPECDFFIVGPRRTLRVLLPSPKGSPYYEPNANERPETMDENFVSRWAMRPHPSGNCRCSFRQSKNRFGTDEERIISDEINRIRTSLCEAEKSGEDIEIVERRISLNLAGISDNKPVIMRDLRGEVDEKLGDEILGNVRTPIGDNRRDDDVAIKNKIVRDLERYIEVLLQEVLSDTIKFFSDAGDTLKRSHDALKKNGSGGSESELADRCETRISENRETDFHGSNTLDISFAFHGDEVTRDETEPNGSYVNRAFGDSSEPRRPEERASRVAEDLDGGYVNRAFSGTLQDPDSLDFDLRKPVSAPMTLDDNLADCVDSGINSVETIEFQTCQEPSLEQSLMEIIDAKFGRGPTSKMTWTDKSDVDKMEIPANTDNVTSSPIAMKDDQDAELQVERSIEPLKKDSQVMRIVETPEKLHETNDQPSFEKLRLELLDTACEDEKPRLTLREKIARRLGRVGRDEKNTEKDPGTTRNDEILACPVELRVKNVEKIRRDIRDSPEDSQPEESADFVKFRKSKKPTVVFLHGFGSSAEIFEHQLEYFTNLGYPCVAPEMLGHGMSSAPDRSRDYHFEKLLKDLELVLEHYAFGVGRKCILVAHNYGCSFATALACKYDSNIHQLVLISGGGPTPLAPPSTEGAGHCCLRAILTPLLMCGLHRDILYSARGRQHPYCGNEPAEQRPSHMKYVLDGMVWPEGDYVFHRRIRTPTLLIHGLRDNKVSLVQECQMERTIIKAFLDAIPTAGHTPMTDCPDQVNHMIHCFIDLWKRKKR